MHGQKAVVPARRYSRQSFLAHLVGAGLLTAVTSGLAQVTPPEPVLLPPPQAPASPVVPTPAPDDQIVQLEAFKVQEEILKGSAADLRALRKSSDVSIDFVSAAQIAKFSPSDLSEIVIRIPGVSVAGGQFAVVRGLSDRFLSTTVHGIKLPSPDPEKQAVQLDLLPASAIEAVIVSKTFVGSQWAESSGGNMDILARAIPSEPQVKFSFGLKLNSNMRDGGPDYSIRGRSNLPTNDTLEERFGFGSRSRLTTGTGDKTWQYVPTHRENFPLGNKLSLEFARAFPVGSHQLGVLVSVFNEASYKQKKGVKQAWGSKRAIQANPGAPAIPPRTPGFPRGRAAIPATPGSPSDFESEFPRRPTTAYERFDYAETESEAVLGATMAVGYRFSPLNEIKFTGLFVQSGIDQSQANEHTLVTDPDTGLLTPVSGDLNIPTVAWNKTIEYFRERNLSVFQLSGSHKLPAFQDLGVSWAAQRGLTYQKEAPFIEANFSTPLATLHETYTLEAGSDVRKSLHVVWGENEESQEAARLDLEWPFRLWGTQRSILKVGGALDSSARNVTGRAVFYGNPSNDITATSPNLAYAQFVNPANSGLSTGPSTAEREIKAYYGSVTLQLLRQIKAVGGARFEDFSLTTTGTGKWGNYTSTAFYSTTAGGFGPFLGINPKENPAFRSEKWYPGMGLIFEPFKSLAIRAHYSETSGRPSLREVSPFFNKSIESGNLVIGNPVLQPSQATSYDFRIEWSPTRTDFFSVSLFRKDIETPIEKLILDTQSATNEYTETWVNNPEAALLKGAEVEFRHSFLSWSRLLADFSLSGNFTWIDASVGENPAVVKSATASFQDPTKIPMSRRLFDQPEFIANLELTWARKNWGTSVTVAAFGISDVMTASGLYGGNFFDLYERSYARFDLIVNQRLSSRLKLRLTAKNIGDPLRGTIYDRKATSVIVERNRYRAGREFGLSISADL